MKYKTLLGMAVGLLTTTTAISAETQAAAHPHAAALEEKEPASHGGAAHLDQLPPGVVRELAGHPAPIGMEEIKEMASPIYKHYRLSPGVIELPAGLDKPAGTEEIGGTPMAKYYLVPPGGSVAVPKGTKVATDLIKREGPPGGHDDYRRPK